MLKRFFTTPVVAINILCNIVNPHYTSAKECCCPPGITQPIGDLVRTYETTGPLPFPIQPPSRIPPFTAPVTGVEEVNYIAAQWDMSVMPNTVPFDLNVSVTETILTEPQHFVRFYAPASGSGPNGVWLVRSQYVRGLTPEQIKDRLALPTLPTHIVNVDLPASPNPVSGKDYALWTGVAGPIAGFGDGGGVQNRILADFNGTNYFPNYQFVVGTRDHPQLIGEFALSYRPMAGNGNAGHVANYLDKYIPCAYSDLENVYTLLDYLNWPDFGPELIQDALTQIGAQDYNAIPFVVTRNSILFSNAILNRLGLLRCGPCHDICDSKPVFVLQGIGEYMNEGCHSHQFGFNNWSGGILGTLDCNISSGLNGGLSVSYLDNYLKWHESRGHAHIKSVKVGAYAGLCPEVACLPDTFYINGLIAGGYNWSHTDRHIKFSGLNRTAKSHQNGYDVDLHLEGGFDVNSCNWKVSPLARVSYFHVRQDGFTEKNAESLNLNVCSFDYDALRTNLGVGIQRSIGCSCFEIIPKLTAAWVYNHALSNRKISSHLKGLGGSFCSEGFKLEGSGFIGSASIALLNQNGFNVAGSYDIETDHRFISQAFRLEINYCF